MYIRTLGQYQSQAAAQRVASELFTRYESDCRGIDVVKRLRKGKYSLIDETAMLERRIRELPQLFRDKAELVRRARLWPQGRVTPQQVKQLIRNPPKEYKIELEKLNVKLGYPKEALAPEVYFFELRKLLVKLGYHPNYYLSDLNSELRRARCELSMNSLRWSQPCGGMEVDDPENISRQVADHYVQTELGSPLNNQKITCSLFGRTGFCDIHYPNGIKIRVNFSKVPSTLIAVQVAPKLGPQREYSYWCFGRKVNLR